MYDKNVATAIKCIVQVPKRKRIIRLVFKVKEIGVTFVSFHSNSDKIIWKIQREVLLFGN